MHWTVSTKETFELNLIPRIKVMIEKEKAHLKFLQDEKKKIEGFGWLRRPFYSTTLIEGYIEITEVSLHRLENKLFDYTEYSKTIKE